MIWWIHRLCQHEAVVRDGEYVVCAWRERGLAKKLSATTDGRPQAQPIMGELQGGECQTGLGLYVPDIWLGHSDTGCPHTCTTD